MKKIFLFSAASLLFFASCSQKSSNMSKNSVAFPGMTVSRADYTLSPDIKAEVEVKEFSTLFKMIKGAKVIGEAKNESRQGIVTGYGLDQASQIAVYRMLDANPNADYLTNIRVQKEYTSKWMLFYTKYNTKVTVTAKAITLKTEK